MRLPQPEQPNRSVTLPNEKESVAVSNVQAGVGNPTQPTKDKSLVKHVEELEEEVELREETFEEDLEKERQEIQRLSNAQREHEIEQVEKLDQKLEEIRQVQTFYFGVTLLYLLKKH